MTVTINGTTGIDKVQDAVVQNATLAAGVPSTAKLPAGTVLQVVQATYSTQTSTTSSTYVDTGLSGSITPTSATSKILVFGTIAMRRGNGSVWGSALQIVRNSTVITQPCLSTFYSDTGSTNLTAVVPFSYLDLPSTTSSTTYKLQMTSQTGAPTIYAQIDNAPSVIIMMEIAA